MKNYNAEEKLISVSLTGRQIALIKAGLGYLHLDNEFNAAVWFENGGGWSLRYGYTHIEIHEIEEMLGKHTKIEPDFGIWGDIKNLSRILENRVNRAETFKKWKVKSIIENKR